MPQLIMFSEFGPWYEIKDGDARGRAMLNRHYSANHYRDGRIVRLFVGPGEKQVLMTADSRALFVWRKFIDKSGQQGVNCAVFRNEGDYLSSDLILAAEELAHLRWPGERLYTYVNARKIKSANPGYCFKMAGWHTCGHSKTRHLVILEKLPCLTQP
ncbi:MAG TPA: hypothetical protein PKM78_17550 [Anaerolineae bacterium]|nr:hypothetical protein [Anaerolineae bacterium]HNU05950.1 hypothetical protein [Anaerolineae bacterium]